MDDFPDEIEPMVEDIPDEVDESCVRVKHILVRTKEGLEARFYPQQFHYFNNQLRLVGTLIVNGVDLGACDIQSIVLFYSVESNQDGITEISIVSESGRRIRAHGRSNIGCNILQDMSQMFPLLPIVSIEPERRLI